MKKIKKKKLYNKKQRQLKKVNKQIVKINHHLLINNQQVKTINGNKNQKHLERLLKLLEDNQSKNDFFLF